MIAFWMLVWRDLRAELRARALLIPSVCFGALWIVIAGMALDGPNRLPVGWGAGLLWLCLFVQTGVHMHRQETGDRELGGLDGLLLAPIDRSLLFYAKWMSAALWLCVSAAVVSAAFFVVLNPPAPVRIGEFFSSLAAGCVGLAGLGSFLATLVAPSSLREVLVPLLMFPLGIPLFLALIRLTGDAMTLSARAPWLWWDVLAAYLVLLAVLPWLLYEPAMEV